MVGYIRKQKGTKIWTTVARGTPNSVYVTFLEYFNKWSRINTDNNISKTN